MSKMIKIEVLSPFKVRLQPGMPVREFTPGVCEIEAEALGHWFMEGCKKEKRFVVVAEPAGAGETESKSAPASTPKIGAYKKAVKATVKKAAKTAAKGKKA